MPAPRTRIRLDRDVAVRVVSDPYSSLVAVAAAGVRDRRAGRSSGPARVLGALPGPGIRALGQIVHPDGSLAPDCLSPSTPERDTRVGDELDRLESMSEDDLCADLLDTFSGTVPRHWEHLDGAMRAWVRDLAEALRALWKQIEPLWARQADLRGRETERLGAAAARGAVDIALAELYGGGRVVDGVVDFDDPDGVEVDAHGRIIVLAPLLTGLTVSLCNLDRRESLWFAAPARSRPAEREDRSGLGSLLTPARAQLLGVLQAEHSMSEIAKRMNTVPATATHQVGALEAAGLVRRRREGRRIWVQRTPRGSALLELYGVRGR